MKKNLLCILKISILFISAINFAKEEVVENEQLLAVVLMVKNEENSIVKTVQPLLQGGVKTFFIFDTGSTDNTISAIEEFFKNSGITRYQIAQEPFINFSASRNRALDLAEEAFPDTIFLLMPDAEWYLENTVDLLKFCGKEMNGTTELYSISITSGCTFYTSRLFRAKEGVRFKGKVHEAPIALKTQTVQIPAHIHFNHRSDRFGTEKTKKRWERDLQILLEEFFEDSTNPRTAFYLAQTYACLSRFEEAFNMYSIRTVLIGWDEENFMAWLRRGEAAAHLFFETEDVIWKERAIQSYFQAWELRPWRAEPLVNLGALFLFEEQFQLAYLFLERACKISYPEKDLLFIDKKAYDYERYDKLGIAAWYVGEYQVGKEAIFRALSFSPEAPHLHRNLALYVMKLESIISECVVVS
jgi:glycosyltransferase involved in cell wall biosynthesis